MPLRHFVRRTAAVVRAYGDRHQMRVTAVAHVYHGRRNITPAPQKPEPKGINSITEKGKIPAPTEQMPEP